MANHEAERSVHATLAANTEDLVSLTGFYRDIEVINRSGTAEIYYKVNGSGPAVGGENCGVLPAVIGSTVEPARRRAASGNIEVRLISTGTPTYSVIGVTAEDD